MAMRAHVEISTPKRRERGVQLVVAITAVTMVAEIAVGYLTGSMALLADGWHMATHVGALGLASAAYWVTRRFAGHRAFVFGTGKVQALSAYTSAIALSFVALAMVVESGARLIAQPSIDFVKSLPVAVLGLVVNVVSVLVLHAHDDDDHDAHHDHNHRAAFLHVVADTFTSALAIGALLAGRYLGWAWLDAISGILGGLVIAAWGVGLLRSTVLELVDASAGTSFEEDIRRELESVSHAKVRDLRVWSLGGAARSCVATIATDAPCDASRYREALARFELTHLTIEVQWPVPLEQLGSPTAKREPT